MSFVYNLKFCHAGIKAFKRTSVNNMHAPYRFNTDLDVFDNELGWQKKWLESLGQRGEPPALSNPYCN